MTRTVMSSLQDPRWPRDVWAHARYPRRLRRALKDGGIGLLSVVDAEAFVHSGLSDRCVRVLVEPLDTDPQEAVAHAAAIEEVLQRAGISLEQVHHGDDLASWTVNERALRRGHGIRTGPEETTVLPHGRLAPDNATLVRATAVMMADLGFDLGGA